MRECLRAFEVSCSFCRSPLQQVHGCDIRYKPQQLFDFQLGFAKDWAVHVSRRYHNFAVCVSIARCPHDASQLQHKEPKLDMAKRVISGALFEESWVELDAEVREVEARQ